MRVSVVTTLYRSLDYLPEFYKRMTECVSKLTHDYEIIFVNDGSPDNSAEFILNLQAEDSKIVLVQLSRNFGHHQALLTGLMQAQGDLIFLIDSDLEEDPGLLRLFWDRISENEDVDVVYGIQSKRKGNFFERVTGRLFYRGLTFLTQIKYPADTLTARLMRKNYVKAVLEFTEKTLDLWTIFLLAGFNQVGIPVTKKHKKTTTYTFAKKIGMSVEIITSLSNRPLYLIFIVGLIWLVLSGAVLVNILIKKWVYSEQIEGWASIMASIWLIGGVIIFLLGIIGIYLSKLFLEIKNRPLTIVKTIYRRQ